MVNQVGRVIAILPRFASPCAHSSPAAVGVFTLEVEGGVSVFNVTGEEDVSIFLLFSVTCENER